MSKNLELSPCPFCNGKAILRHCCIGDKDNNYPYIECENCPANMDFAENTPDEIAVEIWNRRV